MFITQRLPHMKFIAVIGCAAILGACAAPQPVPSDGQDPLEAANRNIHNLNKFLDKNALYPVARGYDAVMPDLLAQGVTNVANTLSLPGKAVNHFLQGDLGAGFKMSSRFLINATIGVAGLFDAASEFKIYEDDTDFGETLYAWGVTSGPYVELPLLGPSNARDAVGAVVDIAFDPIGALLPDLDQPPRIAARAGRALDTRTRYATTIDGLLYDSADSYTQAKLYTIQNRRFQLTGGAASAVSADIETLTLTDDALDDPYFDPYSDPYGDSYEE